MLKKIVSCMALACLCLFGAFMTGCDDEKPDDPVRPLNYYVVLESTVYSNISEYKNFIAICNSIAELKRVCSYNNFYFFDNNYEYNDYNTDAGAILREFTDEYFEKMSLVLCAFCRTNYSGQYRIKKVEVNADKLTMHIKRPDSEVGYEVMNSVFLIAGVDKSFVADVKDLSYVFV